MLPPSASLADGNLAAMTATTPVPEFQHFVGNTVAPSELERVATTARAAGRRLVVGALIVDASGRLFAQRRTPDRVLFPGSWDVVGGHDDDNEGVVATLQREVLEETGWEIAEIREVVAVLDWEVETGPRREIDVIVVVHGDLQNPELEWDKHDAFRWVEEHEINELRVPGSDDFAINLLRTAFSILK